MADPIIPQNLPQGFTAPAGAVINQGTPYTQPTSINSGSITPSSPIPYTTPSPTPIPSVDGLDSTGNATLTQPEQGASDLTTRLETLNNSLIGKSDYQSQQETAAGLPDLQSRQNDLSAQLKGLQNEAKAIPLQLQSDATGRGITEGGLQPIQAARLRTNAIAALGVSSLLDSTNGLIASAQDKVSRAVAAKYDPIQEQIDAATNNLKLIQNSPEYTNAEKNRAQAQLDIQAAKQKTLDQNKADAQTIQSWASAAIANGASPLQAQAILKIGQSDNPDLNAAFQLYAPFAKDPNATQKALLDLQQQRANIAKTQADTKKTLTDIGGGANIDPAIIAGWVQNIKNGTAKLSDISANPALKNAVSTALSTSGSSSQQQILQTTQDSLKELQDMVDNNHGFSAAVGFPGLTNIIPGSAAQDFKAKLAQVKNDIVLPNLTLLHGLGRVTDREFQALTSAVTSLSTSLSEDQFKTELKTITDRINKAASTPSDTTLMQGPDGIQYNVPNDNVDAFIKNGGKKL